MKPRVVAQGAIAQSQVQMFKPEDIPRLQAAEGCGFCSCAATGTP